MTDRRMPVKTATIDLTEDGYPGFTAERRTNLPMGFVSRLIDATEEEESRRGWLKVFPSWDFVDDEGEPIPHTTEGFDLIPQDLFQAMVTRGFEAAKEAAMPSPLGKRSAKGAGAASRRKK